MNETEQQIAEAQKKLDSFMQEFRELKARYPEIKIVGDDDNGARAYILANEFNGRDASLE